MRRALGIVALTVTTAVSGTAAAALRPADVVGGWSVNRECRNGSDFTYVMNGNQMHQVVRDGRQEYRNPVRIQIDGGLLRVHVDEKTYTYRLQSKNSLQVLQYTDSRTGLTAKLTPRTWFRCS